MATSRGGSGRISTKAKLAGELVLLGRVIAEARERAGIRQSAAAERLGLPPSYLSKIENGTRRLDVVELLAIAEAIETDPAEIVAELQRELRRQE